MIKILEDLSRNKTLPTVDKHTISSKIYKAPNAYNLLNYGFMQSLVYFRNSLIRVFSYKVRWNVAFAKFQPNSFIVSNSIKIQNPAKRFLADPFLCIENNRQICFVEDYFYDEAKGKISAYEIFEDSYLSLGVVLEEKFHLSFPYIFKFEENLYMCPESAQNKDIRIYKCDLFPLKWSLHAVLKTNISAADTMIFSHDERWYMLSNICSSQMGDHNSELHLFSSSHPFNDPWKPASRYPIYFDSRHSRNAGLFEIDGDIFRVNQVHNQASYGTSFEFNRLLKISDSILSEEKYPYKVIDLPKKILGTHHFHVVGNLCVYDYCNYEKII